MEELFLKMLNMSITASYVIVFVIIVRIFLKKLPKSISYILWSVVAIRLSVPFSFTSAFSLLPKNINTTPIPNNIGLQSVPQVETGLNVIDVAVNSSLPIAEVGASVNPMQIYIMLGMCLWVLGMLAFFTYYMVSVLKLKKQLVNSKCIFENIYVAENLKTPFVIGLVKPKIYLPDGVSDDEIKYIVMHEQIHIKRKDYLVKTYAFVLLGIYWLNPLVWIAFILLNRDMEFACDERVLRESEDEIKKAYATSLVNLSTDTHFINRIAFGEGDVKVRVKNVLQYKKRNVWLVLGAVFFCVVIGVGLLTNPSYIRDDEGTDLLTNTYVNDVRIVEDNVYDSLVGEESDENGLFRLGMTSDEVYEVLVDDSLGLGFDISTDNEGNYDDKFLREMVELEGNAAVQYEYTLTNGLHLYFDSDKILKVMIIQHPFPVSSYADAINYAKDNPNNKLYTSELTTEKGLNLISTLEDLKELYGEPEDFYARDNGDLYSYQLRDDLYLKVIVINGEDNTPFVYRISYDYTKPYTRLSN